MGLLKKILKIISKNLIGIVIFTILFIIANLLTYIITNITYLSIINFLNKNLILIIAIILVSFLSELFWTLYFPFNLPAPIFSGVFATLIAQFLIGILFAIKNTVNLPPGFLKSDVISLIYSVVFLVVLIFGYLNILIESSKPKKVLAKKRMITEKEEQKKEMDEIKNIIKKERYHKKTSKR